MSQQLTPLQVLEQYLNIAVQKGGFTLQDSANIVNALGAIKNQLSQLEEKKSKDYGKDKANS